MLKSAKMRLSVARMARCSSADISVAHHKDGHLPYSLLYFIELKMPKYKLNTSENSGQVLDYFNAIYEKQPNRSKFVAILSNFQESWVYIANYSYNGVAIDKQCVLEFADAIIYADQLSKTHYSSKIPELDSRLESEYNILALSKPHFLLSVPGPGVLQIHGHHTRSRDENNYPGDSSSSDNSWHSPSRHLLVPGGRFVLKMGQQSDSVRNEISILNSVVLA